MRHKLTEGTGWKNISDLARICIHIKPNHVGCNNIVDDIDREIKIAVSECTDIIAAEDKYTGDIYVKLERNPDLKKQMDNEQEMGHRCIEKS